MQHADGDAVAAVATEVPAVEIETARPIVTAVEPVVAEHELRTSIWAGVLETAVQAVED